MSERDDMILEFLATNGWGDAKVAWMKGDASTRRYARLHLPDASAILMDSPKDDTRPFVRIARHLTAQGLSAPEIYAEDLEQGMLILEDLGDAIFARLLEQSPGLEPQLYAAATDLLVELHGKELPALEPYDAAVMTDLAAMSYDWYQLGASGKVNHDQRARFVALLRAELDPLDDVTPVLVQRDYHAENVLWLPDREGVARVGLLDFQDARSGHPAYDLVSILQDARRDVPPDIEADMITRYVSAMGVDAKAFRAAYLRLGAQRNLRILMIFARLSMAYGKAHYVDLIPRVWAHLLRDLEAPGLEDLRTCVLETLPAPTPAILQSLKDQCGQHPLPS